jgi:hypothetical protein
MATGLRTFPSSEDLSVLLNKKSHALCGAFTQSAGCPETVLRDQMAVLLPARMKTFLANVRKVAISGFFFLLPIVVIFVIISKAWNALTSVGTRMAGVFGVSSIVGLKGGHIFTGLLMLAICLVCGLLIRVSFVAGLHSAVERWMSKHIPHYDTYKTIAEEKLQNKTRILPYGSALSDSKNAGCRHMLSSVILMAIVCCSFQMCLRPVGAMYCLRKPAT